jgi:hypothetical protein
MKGPSVQSKYSSPHQPYSYRLSSLLIFVTTVAAALGVIRVLGTSFIAPASAIVFCVVAYLASSKAGPFHAKSFGLRTLQLVVFGYSGLLFGQCIHSLVVVHKTEFAVIYGVMFFAAFAPLLLVRIVVYHLVPHD